MFPKLDVVGWYATGTALGPKEMEVQRKVSYREQAVEKISKNIDMIFFLSLLNNIIEFTFMSAKCP